MKEEIVTFDARKISADIRDSVSALLQKNAKSFDPKVRFGMRKEDSHEMYRLVLKWVTILGLMSILNFLDQVIE